MRLERRALATLVLGVPAARAATTDLVMHCDTPLAAPLRAMAEAFQRRTGVRLRIFPTAPNAIAAQLVREIQNDVVVTQPAVLEAIAAAGLLADAPRPGPWRNRLVVAARIGAARPPISSAALAAPDPGWGGGPDGPALLREAGLRPARAVGTFDTSEARALLLAGEVDYALLHASELRPALQQVAAPGLTASVTCSAALTRSARRPHPETLMRFLGEAEAAAALRGAGLEMMS